MALQVWLPLNGNLKNLGLDDIEFTKSTVSRYESGKIGQALQMKDSNVFFTAPSLTDVKVFSVAFWYKAISDSSITANWRRVLSFDTKNADGTAGSLFRFESSYGLTTSHALSVHNNTSQSLGSIGHSIIALKDEWHHACFIHTPEQNLTYLDGTLIATGDGAAGTINGTIKISDTSAGTDPNGLMNDLRIYDHALSQKEIKLLSQGLIAHYPLNDGIGGENILKDSHIEKSGAANVAQWFRWNLTTTLSTNTIYTISFDAKTTVTTDVFYIGWANGDNTQELLSSGVEVIQSYKRYSFTGSTTKTNINSIIISNYKGYGRGNTNNTNGVLSVKNVKLELGEKSTPWIPNSADALYSKMGLDNGIVYDCSGYEHNGSVVGTGVTYSSEAPRYTCSTDFQQSDATNSYINLGTGGKVSDEITVSEWVYMDTWTTDPHPFSCTESGGWNIEKNSNKPTFPVYVNTVGYVHSINGDISTPLWTDLSSGWHMFTGTYDGFNIKLYIDGELVANKATGKTDKLPIHYHATNPILIHSEPTSTTGSNSYPACKMSDMRIYATALSAEDIKSLYETRASIDNYSNTYTYEFMEV